MSAPQNHEIAKTAPASVWVWDHDRRRIVWANDSALRFWGERTVLDLLDRDFPPSDPATVQFARLLHATTAADAERVRARLTLSTAQGPQRVEAIAARFTLTDGRTGLRISATPVPKGMESEPERIREIFATAPLAMTLFAGDGRMLAQNDAADLAFGDGSLSSLAERYGARQTARDALRTLLVSGSFSHSAMLQTRAGPRRHRVTMRRMLDPVTGGYAALVSFSDTVEREEAPALAAPLDPDAQETLITAMDAGVAVYDDALKPLYASARARALLGMSDALPDAHLTDLFPQDRHLIATALVDIRDGRTDTAVLDLTTPHPDGRSRPIKLTMRKGVWKGASAWIAAITDITLDQQAAITVQRVSDDRDTALEAVGVGTAILRADGMIAELNATAAELLGWSRTTRRRLTDAFEETAATAFAEAFKGPGSADGLEMTLSDTAQSLLVGIAPKSRFNQDYRVVTLRAIERGGNTPGIFERREAVSRASHELRTPLTAIIGFTQLMLEDPAPIRSEAYVGYLNDINDSGAYMLRLLQDLLDMRRIEADSLKLDSTPIDLGNLLRVITREQEFAARKRDVDIILSVEDGLPPVLADLHTMRQAMTNLIGNAVKFTAASGWVRVAASRRASGAVQVEVIDNGDGMTPDELTLALEPFGQMPGSQHSFGGAGMGVPLAKGFIEANRARFDLTSEKGLGTIARVVFPQGRVTERN